MNNTTIGDFSILSPSQKKELERKRQEQEAREAAEIAKRAEAARMAREAAKRNAEAKAAAFKAAEDQRNAEKERKKMGLIIGIGVLCFLIVVVLWAWIHFSSSAPLNPQQDGGNTVALLLLLAFVALPAVLGLGFGISVLKDKLNEIK